MKVLYLSKALVAAAYRDKLTALGEAGAEVVAVIPDRWGAERVEGVRPGSDRVRMLRPVLHGRNHFHLYPGLERVLAAEHPDLVHVDEEPYSLVTLQATAACRRRGIPCVFFAWQNLEKRLPPPFPALRRRVFATVDGGIAGTPAAGRVLREWGYEGPLAVVPQFGVDPDRFVRDPAARRAVRGRLGLDDADFVAGFVGRLVPEKGLHLLIRAVAEIPRARLLVAGDGPERERLRRLAHRLGIAHSVKFLGKIASTRVPETLNALDVLALPSLGRPGWREQFGRVLVEAMACEVPVVGSDSGEIPHVIGEAGLIVPEGDVDALREALERLAGDDDLRARLAGRGRARVLERFTHRHVGRATVDFYGEVLAGRGR